MKISKLFLFSFLFSFLLISCTSQKETELKVLQLNLWIQCELVADAVKGTVDYLDQTDADIILLCELKRGDEQFITNLINDLKDHGKVYYTDGQYMNVGVLSKYKPVAAETFYPTEEEGRPIVKVTYEIGQNNVVVYSAHLDHQHYQPYMPRGYSGTTWQSLDAPITDPDTILAANRVALRDEAIAYFIKEAQTEIDKGNIVIMGGDLNEPSHLDWQANTKDLYSHNGVVVNWDCSMMLAEAGYIDTYRELYPSAMTHPGFTYPAGNKDADLKGLVWVPIADERDRIDFIYYSPNPHIQLKEAAIAGPSQSVAFGKIVESESEDKFIIPTGVWPTDHKGMFALFTVK